MIHKETQYRADGNYKDSPGLENRNTEGKSSRNGDGIENTQ